MLARVGTLYGSALPYYALVRTILETLLCTYLHYYALICTSVLHCSLLFTNLHSSALLFTTLHYCTLLQTAVHCYNLQCTVHCCGEQHCGPPQLCKAWQVVISYSMGSHLTRHSWPTHPSTPPGPLTPLLHLAPSPPYSTCSLMSPLQPTMVGAALHRKIPLTAYSRAAHSAPTIIRQLAVSYLWCRGCGLSSYGKVWYGMERYGMVWYFTVRYGML